MTGIPLSVLDLSPVSAGSTPQQALRNTIDLARQAEAWGYRRFWLAEHHFVQVASSASITLIGLVAAATETIRVGSAAVQLGHHTSASVVEAFGTIDALHPGRLDLGLGRSGHRGTQLRDKGAAPATPPRETEVRDGVVIPPPFSPGQFLNLSRLLAGQAALQLPGAEPIEYTRQVNEIRALLDGSYQTPDGVALHAVPGEGADIELWLFGSSGGESARLAGELGLPFAANYHVSPGTILETVAAYRDSFKPSERHPKPYLVVSADVVVAEDERTAQRLAASYGHWVYSIRSGEGAAAYQDPDTAGALTGEQRQLIEDRLATQFVGTPAQVAARLTALQELTGADEIVITSVTFRHADRLTSHRLLAREWGLTGVNGSAPADAAVTNGSR
ncbi:LLM class flavin-dependent oxidoreductase [Nocardia sp. BMG111209]|uniref:LLM class flavin-dependent oxidoreductase n=1 Tax=Nocardia sp. BMG111209 TaxID=1160137 RepID=UPI000381EAC5|nr:LLM class flavin-dependent oxidoreductase [Nocardia sp. BMG111209]